MLDTEEQVFLLQAGLDKPEGQNANLKLDSTSEMVEVKSEEKPGATVVPTLPARRKKESQMAGGLSAGKSVQELKMQVCSISLWPNFLIWQFRIVTEEVLQALQTALSVIFKIWKPLMTLCVIFG